MLPSVFCFLFSVFCLLSSAFCLLSSVSCLLPSVFCLLSSAFCLLSPASCLRIVFHCDSPNFAGTIVAEPRRHRLPPESGYPAAPAAEGQRANPVRQRSAAIRRSSIAQRRRTASRGHLYSWRILEKCL